MSDQKLFLRWMNAAHATGMEIVRVHVLHDEPELEGTECVHYRVGYVEGSFLVAPNGSRKERRDVVVFMSEQAKEHMAKHGAVTE